MQVIKWRRMRWVGHVARMGEVRGCIGYCAGDKMEKNEMGWACGAYG